MPAAVGVYRVQVVLQGKSLLPRDRFINVWHFANPVHPSAVTDADWATLRDELRDFYMTPTAAAGGGIAGFLGGHLTISLTDHHLRIYDLAQAKPRTPRILPLNLSLPTAATKLPAELAVCCSFFAGSNTPGRRGRVYLGPFNNTALNTGGEHDALVAESLRTGAWQAFVRLVNAPGLLTPVLYKPAKPQRVTKGGTTLAAEPASYELITGGFVDNAFDIQRRRGLRATLRTGGAVV